MLSFLKGKVSMILAGIVGFLLLVVSHLRLSRAKDKQKMAEDSVKRSKVRAEHSQKVNEVLKEGLKNETSSTRRGYFDQHNGK